MMRHWQPGWPIDLDLVLGPLSRGRRDPVARRSGRQEWWLTGRWASGAATLSVARHGDGLAAQAWGSGAAEVLDRLPDLLGNRDDPTGFDPAQGTVVAAQWRVRQRHWRVPATRLTFQTAVQAVLEQKVTGIESRRSWFRLCRDYGMPAPGPAPQGMQVAPDRIEVGGIPSWWWRRAGVDHSRAGTVLRLARQRLPDDPVAAAQRLRSVPGIGPWTIAEVGFRAFGDADAVSVGDYHLANQVGYALAGRPRSTDEQMLDLLAPYAGHRYRAVRMIELSGIAPPRFGPRITLPGHR
jgi:3-methyladenine DNA glycosylase/8-oxoguanine DNA glycosylase